MSPACAAINCQSSPRRGRCCTGFQPSSSMMRMISAKVYVLLLEGGLYATPRVRRLLNPLKRTLVGDELAGTPSNRQSVVGVFALRGLPLHTYPTSVV